MKKLEGSRETKEGGLIMQEVEKRGMLGLRGGSAARLKHEIGMLIHNGWCANRRTEHAEAPVARTK